MDFDFSFYDLAISCWFFFPPLISKLLVMNESPAINYYDINYLELLKFAFINKVNGIATRGSNSAIFNFVFLNRGQILKERICSYRSKFLPVRVDPFLEAFCGQGSYIGCHINYFPLF